MNVDLLLQIDRSLREYSGFDAIRPEARLIFLLKKHGPLSVKEAMSFSQTSYRGFYTVLARLIDAGLVLMNTDGDDRRVRKIVLSEAGMAPMGEQERILDVSLYQPVAAAMK